MEQQEKINELSLKAIPDLYGKNFFIPDYQRGYRWGTRQVEQLMNDLCKFFDDRGKGDFYCLQPIVVKELAEGEKTTYGLHSDTDDNRWYEIIDGQQRLTTIRIILALFKKIQGRFKYKFTIKYKTRSSLGESTACEHIPFAECAGAFAETGVHRVIRQDIWSDLYPSCQ